MHTEENDQFLREVEHAWRANISVTRAATDRKGKPRFNPDGSDKTETFKLTRLHVHIAAKMVFWKRPIMRQREIATAACCSIKTVQRAIRVLSALSLLSWDRQVLATRSWRAQVANAYRFLCKEKIGLRTLYSSAKLSPPGKVVAKPDLFDAAATAIAAGNNLLAAARTRLFTPNRGNFAWNRKAQA